MPNTTKYVVAAIFGLLGLFYAIMPHSVHINSGIGFGLSHTVHIAIGAVLVIGAITVFVAAGKP